MYNYKTLCHSVRNRTLFSRLTTGTKILLQNKRKLKIGHKTFHIKSKIDGKIQQQKVWKKNANNGLRVVIKKKLKNLLFVRNSLSLTHSTHFNSSFSFTHKQKY